MNTHIHSDRKLAEALKSLSIEPAGHDQVPAAASRRNRTRWLALSAAAFAVCGGGLAMIRLNPDLQATLFRQPVQESPPEPVQASTIALPDAAGSGQTVALTQMRPVQPSPAQREITGSGYVVAAERTAVYARYAGQVATIEVALGDHVAKGQVMIRLQDPDAGFALQKAEIARRTARLELDASLIAETEAAAVLERDTRLFGKGTLSRQSMEASQSAHSLARNTVAKAEVALDSAEIGLKEAQMIVGHLEVRAPIAGTITEMKARIGDNVLGRSDSSRGEGDLLTITDTGSIVIEADVSETSIGLLEPGQTGEAVLDGFPDAPFPIRLERIAPTISAEKGTVGLRLSLIDPPAGIRPNMAASIRLTGSLPSGHTTE